MLLRVHRAVNSELPLLEPIGYSSCMTKYTEPHSNSVCPLSFSKLIGFKKLYAVCNGLLSFFPLEKKDFLAINLLINISGMYEGTYTGYFLRQGQVRSTTVLWCCWWTVRQTIWAAAVCAGDADRQRHNNQVKTPTGAQEMTAGGRGWVEAAGSSGGTVPWPHTRGAL